MEISDSKKFPKDEHYAMIIFKTKSIHHEGDERSRTNPGHGYPAHTEEVSNHEYHAFEKTEAGKLEWEKSLKDSYGKNKNVVGFIAGKILKISTEIKLGLNDLP